MVSFFKSVCCFLVLMNFLSGCSDGESESTLPAKPTHVLLIGIDTMRGDHLQGQGLDWMRTPALASLAADGVTFSKCRSTAPWTLPSFASIFTGLRPYNHGTVGGLYGKLPSEKKCIAEYLTAIGFEASGLVSIDYLTEAFDMARGYEAYPPPMANLEGDVGTNMARSFFSHFRDQPFYLFMHYYDPHTPYVPPAPFDRMYYQGDERKPGQDLMTFLKSERNLAKNRDSAIYDFLEGVTDTEFPIRQHAACVSYSDSRINNLITHLKELGIYDQMLIIVVADHGEHLGEHDYWFTHAMPYEETLHVPFICKLPGNQYSGTVIEKPVSTLDILPTVLDLVRIPVPTNLDGNSLLDVMAGRQEQTETLLIAEQGSSLDEFCKVIYDWPWKLMMKRELGQDSYELYHLVDDPTELKDLATEKPDVVDRLRELLWREFNPQTPLVATDEAIPADIDEAAKRRLKALGY